MRRSSLDPSALIAEWDGKTIAKMLRWIRTDVGNLTDEDLSVLVQVTKSDFGDAFIPLYTIG